MDGFFRYDEYVCGLSFAACVAMTNDLIMSCMFANWLLMLQWLGCLPQKTFSKIMTCSRDVLEDNCQLDLTTTILRPCPNPKAIEMM